MSRVHWNGSRVARARVCVCVFVVYDLFKRQLVMWGSESHSMACLAGLGLAVTTTLKLVRFDELACLL